MQFFIRQNLNFCNLIFYWFSTYGINLDHHNTVLML